MRLEIDIELGNEVEAKAVAKALKPETAINLRNVRASISQDGRTIHILIESPDPSSMRATTNSILRLMETILRTLRTLK
jgi:tRNA threonylcarbamoyladenosine modification (KEOPS) complex  Pcc1 subunit